VKALIAIALLIVVVSLGQALYAMASGPQNSARVVKSLTVRISVSVGLFIALMVAWKLGYIEPRGMH
jgi:multisubunit Na+/H+ antiporter MnhF subunit